jgi:hypothetical protein
MLHYSLTGNFIQSPQFYNFTQETRKDSDDGVGRDSNNVGYNVCGVLPCDFLLVSQVANITMRTGESGIKHYNAYW